MTNNDALIEIAIEIMKGKNKPQTINAIAKEAFEAKGIKFNEKSEEYSQFLIDFMLCGDFIACAEDKASGLKLWDLKYRQTLEKQNKENFDDYYEDEEVAMNELKDDYGSSNQSEYDNSYNQEDEEEEHEEKDDIEEELEDFDDGTGFGSDLDLEEDEEGTKKGYDADDDVEEDSYDDEDE